MTVEDDDDRAAFLDPEEFGASVVLTHGDVVSDSVDGILSNGASIFGNASDVGAIDRAPFFICRETDLLDGFVQGDGVRIGSTRYVARAVLPDGTGMVRLDLELAADGKS